VPTVKTVGPYRIFFYAGDRDEPIHVHVEREDRTAKFWLNPVRLQRSGGFNRNELNKIHTVLVEYENELVEAWHVYFNG